MTKTKGKGKKQAIVAIARRLGVLMYTLMKNGTEYEVRHFTGPKPVRAEELAHRDPAFTLEIL
jgi:hypothetical protein